MANFPYKEVSNKLQSGPSTRGQKRKKYKMTTGQELDVYGIVLAAIALDPPLISITIDELKDRVDKLIDSSNKATVSFLHSSKSSFILSIE